MHDTVRCFLPARCLWVACLCLLARASPAAAANFDPDTGRLTLTASPAAVSLDDATSTDALVPVAVLDADGAEIPAEEVAQQYQADSAGLEGAGALVLGGRYAFAYFGLERLAPRLQGRRAVFRFWQRPEGTRGGARVLWAFPGGQEAAPLGIVSFYPTGRATDDGWEEWSAGPVDFQAGGVLDTVYFLVGDVQYAASGWGSVFDRDAELRFRMDALEIEDVGPAAVRPDACTVVSEATACAPFGLCFFGRCVDTAIVAGSAPPTSAQIRDDYLDRRLFEFRVFEGGRVPQQHMAELQAAFDAVRPASASTGFWSGVQAGVEKLPDGHAMAPTPNYSLWYGATNLGVCLHLGEADLLPGGGSAPLVFSAVGTNPVAVRLKEGDALTAIDGLSPDAWKERAARLISFTGDPATFQTVSTPDLMAAAARSGSRLTFVRCSRTGPAPAPCSAGEVETLEVDLAVEVGGPLWRASLPAWWQDQSTCDFRFRRALSDLNVTEYDYAGYVDEGGIRTLLINGVPDPGWSQEWWRTVEQALTQSPPARLLVDQRLGGGGSISSVDLIMAILLKAEDFHSMELYPFFEPPLDEALRRQLAACGQEGCAGFFEWVLGDPSGIGNRRGLLAGARVAFLNAFDASGNDYTSRLATFRSSPTQIFGPAPTFGAFGAVYGLPAFLDEPVGGSLQVYDTLFFATPDASHLNWETSHGVPPTTRVQQRQSDAVQGIDTTVQAARAWLLSE